MLKRSDNLLATHFPRFHADVASGTHPFLKVGQRPGEGAQHVVELFQNLGSNTERPKPDQGSSEPSQGDDEDEEAEQQHS